jgi:dolichyl-phosphate beta-glucosyltransferase
LRRSISIIIPAYNEEKRLPATLAKIQEYLGRSRWDFIEVLVVDDGSRDGTAEVARQAGLRVVSNPGNRGKGYTVRHGIHEAQGEWILFSDADLSTPIEELERLWGCAERENAPVVIGSRAVDRSLIGIRQPFLRDRIGRLFNLVMRLIVGLPFRDTQCGFKLFESQAARSVFSRQRLDGFGFDVEVLYIARRQGLKCLEVPVRWNDVAGTKVSLWRGVSAFLDPLRVRWNSFTCKYQ